ncbi:unnamed protein product [Calypogeia fissa]
MITADPSGTLELRSPTPPRTTPEPWHRCWTAWNSLSTRDPACDPACDLGAMGGRPALASRETRRPGPCHQASAATSVGVAGRLRKSPQTRPGGAGRSDGHRARGPRPHFVSLLQYVP